MASGNGNGDGHALGARARLPAPERTPDEIRAAIERARAQVARSVVALRREVAQATDWRAWVARRPGLFIAAAVALGFLAGAGGRRRRRNIDGSTF